MNLTISYDKETDILTIESIKYSGELFRLLGFKALVGQTLKIVSRKDGIVTFKTVDEED